MKKRLYKLFAVIVTLCLALFGIVACSGDGSGGGGGDGSEKLQAVDAESISAEESINNAGNYSLVFSWSAVKDALSYSVVCNGVEMTLQRPNVDLAFHPEIALPDDMTFVLSIRAKSVLYEDSDAVSYIYNARGAELNSLEIVSFENGIIKWTESPLAVSYKLTVTGEVNATENLTKPEFDTNTGAYKGKALTVSIYPVGSGKYAKDGAPSGVSVNAAHTQLCLAPVKEYTVKDGVLSWKPVGGAKGYKVLDLGNNIVRVDGTSYDMSDRLLVYGVYPISAKSGIADAEIVPVDIPYLAGSGTTADPYLIKTPFDLRAIDYYEIKYVEELQINSKAAAKTYKIANDLNYNDVAALEDESNLYTLSAPFYGTLDGDGKKLSNIHVNYDGGYWALFDFIVKGATVKNIKFSGVSITNVMQDNEHPINAAIATIANMNYGTVDAITLEDAQYSASGGEVAGIVSHNYGTVKDCTVSGRFRQIDTGFGGQGCMAMAGIVLENAGGSVTGNTVKALQIDGSTSYEGKTVDDEWVQDKTKPYNNILAVGGIVGINRSGDVKNNTCTSLTVTKLEKQCGGIVGRNEASSSTVASNTVASLIVNSKTISSSTGTAESYIGKNVGKQGK